MKRFTETTKWQDPWYRKLKPRHKCLWQYLCDACDQTGVIDADWDLISFQIGEKVDESCLDIFEGRISLLENGKIFIRGFIKFQYGILSHDCKPHKPIFDLCDRHGIDPTTREPHRLLTEKPKGNDTLSQNPPKGIHTLQEKEKDKEKDTSDGFEKFWEAYPRKVGKGAALSSWHKRKPPIDQVLAAIRKARQSPDWLKERGAFIPHPSTWLNQARWEDEGMDYAALLGKRDSGAARCQEIDESNAFRWRSERYPESLEVHPTAATFPFRAWPDSIKSEYRNRNRNLQAA